MKDVISPRVYSHSLYFKTTFSSCAGMPTCHNSPSYHQSGPSLVDAAPVVTLGAAGAVMFGKTTPTEFASSTEEPPTADRHDSPRTPGGSSSGSGAAVDDYQVPVALRTQTGGSTIMPGSLNEIQYASHPFLLKGSNIAFCRTWIWEEITEGYGSVLTPSAADEAPVGGHSSCLSVGCLQRKVVGIPKYFRSLEPLELES
ncbi:amidase signature domain-containing protein [Amylocarpus encephaloides]|uniref:Amidase signature domain-containing protein n=1 Tax=Amylocarpus encephaloides TaxID=45428 RepID=A0A9P7YSF4_9HELO|nr:amidase signature domain-containing protein [Amylocarpus encephaloides]